eukprot:3231819-Pleurochrysis_carterae.AAC.1
MAPSDVSGALPPRVSVAESAVSAAAQLCAPPAVECFREALLPMAVQTGRAEAAHAEASFKANIDSAGLSRLIWVEQRAGKQSRAAEARISAYFDAVGDMPLPLLLGVLFLLIGLHSGGGKFCHFRFLPAESHRCFALDSNDEGAHRS